MTNKTTPKLTAMQQVVWERVQEWHGKYVHNSSNPSTGFYPGLYGHPRNNIMGKNSTFQALARKGMLVATESRLVGGAVRYTIHPDFMPEYFDDIPATPAPAAAPAPVNNAPVKSLIDAGMGYTERYKPENWRSEPPVSEPAPTNPTYDSLKALADKQDEYIQDLENALRSALVNGKTYLREVDRLGARIAELETENADLRGDMERLAASELELVQQNALLNSVVDRLSKRTDAVVAAANDACAEYGGDMADDAMHTLADTIGYPWN